jgi:hydrogenase nickel incorporation protein HypB
VNEKEIRVYRDLMGANEKWASEIRTLLTDRGMLMVNLIGSPGSGKTTLLEQMVDDLKARCKFAVLEGDVETTRDAERLQKLDVPVSQLLSGGSCHLEAKLVHRALSDFLDDGPDVVFVENVGNMVCPAEFDIGEHAKVAVLSITEGEEKPLKYPLLFREAKAVVLTKTDLLPYVPFDLDACREHLRQVNGGIPVFEVSSTTGEGVAAFTTWILEQREAARG